MGMAVNTNLAALNAHRNLSNTQNDLSKSLEKLSSGLRINRAADDAAGLSISEGLRSQVNGMTVAARNAQDGISVIQTAEGALNETHSILQRMRDLAVQAGNDSNNEKSRTAISNEVSQLVSELDRLGKSTNFNGINLLDGSNPSLSFQVGADGDANSQVAVDLSEADIVKLSASLGNAAGGSVMDVVTPTAVTGVTTFTIGDATNNKAVNVTLGAAGTYTSVQEVADALNADENFGESLLASVNSDNQLVVRALNGQDVVGGAVAGTHAAANATFGASGANPGTGLDLLSATGASNAIGLLDTQITNISAARAELGAKQNRFESAINSLNVTRENLQAAESRIRDVDMAAEMVNFTRSNILSQAGTAMLAQANQSNQGVLQLLG